MKHSWYLKKKEVKKNKCKYCHFTENLTIDHKQPKILGGTDEIKNLQCLCGNCNLKKGKIPHKQLQALARWFISTPYFAKIMKKAEVKFIRAGKLK